MNATQAPPAGQPLLTMPQAAQAFGRSVEWVKARCDTGELACWVVNRRRYTTAASISACLDGRRLQPLKTSPRASGRAQRAAAELLQRLGV